VSLEYCKEEWRTRRTVHAEFIQGLEAFGKEVKLGGNYWRPASSQKHEMAVKLYKVFQKLLDEKKLKAHPVEVVGSTLGSIVEGMKQLKSGTTSGKRLAVVYDDKA
jgi:hypothetical protein